MEQPVNERFKKVAPHELDPMLQVAEELGFLMLDVRSPDEYRTENVVGARNVPVDQLRNDLKDLDRNTSLLIYCKVGKRCVRAVDELEQMGFQKIMVLDGGIEALKAHRMK
ncbi:MAG: rhodanese-like domain-containing protein [Euryarchaeota archaeon]|nr:rhodanese-like domain-containing protein [Euryarchaeota archaeon]